MKRRLIPIITILVLLALGGEGYAYFSANPDAWQQAVVRLGLPIDTGAEEHITASGFIEAGEINLSAEVSGRINRLTIAKGDVVSAGQTLVTLDMTHLDAQLKQVEAQIALAEAQLRLAEAGATREQLAVAEAAISLAVAEREAARQAGQDAIRLRDNPQQLDAQIDAVKRQIELAQLQASQIALLRDMAELKEGVAADFWKLTQEGRDWSIHKTFVVDGEEKTIKRSGHYNFPEGEKHQASVEWNLATMDLWRSWVNLNSTQAAQGSAQTKLNTLLAQRSNPLQANLQVTQAQSAHQTKAAAVKVAQARRDQLEAGPTETQISLLEAQLLQAFAQLATLAEQREKYTLASPINGIVVAKAAYPGEIALPGNTLLTVADLHQVTLTVFVAESVYGRLRVNQAVQVFVDSYPKQPFQGTISHINDEAEFTPKNVQTQAERVNLVFAVKITLPNKGGLLKPGMPADAVFIEALTTSGGDR